MNVSTQNFIIDACNQNHILIAGASGSGKSVLLKSIVYYITAQGYNFSIIDLKKVSLIEFKPLAKKHFITYAETETAAEKTIDFAINLMQKRYKRMERKNTDKSTETPFYIVIDECADLFQTVPKIKEKIIKLLRLGRAANVRLILATQSPDRKTIPSQIQQNITTKFALRCRSAIESRQIIGMSCAEKLHGVGNAYYLSDNLERPALIKINMLERSTIDELIQHQTKNKLFHFFKR